MGKFSRDAMMLVMMTVAMSCRGWGGCCPVSGSSHQLWPQRHAADIWGCLLVAMLMASSDHMWARVALAPAPSSLGHRALSSLGELESFKPPSRPCHHQPRRWESGRAWALELGQLALRPAVPLTSCGMAGKLLDLSEPIFLICKSGI